MDLLNWIDVFALGLLLFFALTGYFTGLIRSLFQLASLGVGALGAWSLTQPIKDWCLENIYGISPDILTAIIFVSLFLGVFFLTRWTGKFLHELLKKTPFGTLDRLGGLFLGILKSAVILLILFSILDLLPLRGGLRERREKSFSFSAWKSLEIHPLGWMTAKNLDIPGFELVQDPLQWINPDSKRSLPQATDTLLSGMLQKVSRETLLKMLSKKETLPDSAKADSGR